MSGIREDFARRWIPWLTVAGVAVVGAVIVTWQSRRVAPIAHPITVVEPTSVELAVEQLGDVLVVRWNPLTSTIAKATHGLLSVSDGDFERKIGLTNRDLVSGMVRYAPLSRYVSFQLALYDGPASGKGSVLFLARNEPEVTTVPPKKSVSRPGVGRPSSGERMKVVPAKRNSERSAVSVKPMVVARPLTPLPPLAMEPVHEVTVTAPAIQEVASPAFKAPPAPAPPSYRILVTTQPSRGTAFEQMLSKVPFVKRIAKTPTTEELVKPVRRVDPQVADIPDLSDPLDTSVEIQVDASGKVKTARFVDLDRAPGNLEWAALRAAKAWRFEVPRNGQSPWLVLTFHYELTKGLRAE